jgi:hypothetical protein
MTSIKSKRNGGAGSTIMARTPTKATDGPISLSVNTRGLRVVVAMLQIKRLEARG